jgi:hypothetical protein
MKPPLQLSPLIPEQIDELNELYRTTKVVRLRTRTQMILISRRTRDDGSNHCPD